MNAFHWSLRTLSAASLAVVAWGSALGAPSSNEDPKAWCLDFHRRTANAQGAVDGAYLGKIAIVTGMPKVGAPELASMSDAAFRRVSFLRPADAGDFALTVKVNAWGDVQLSEEQVMVATGADLLLNLAGARWRLDAIGQDKQLANIGETDQGSTDGTEIARAVRRILGYDAIVLEQRDALVLVKGPDLAGVTKKLQGLTIAGSDARLKVTGNDKSGAAFLQLLRGGQECSIFRVAVNPTGDVIPFGTKVVMEDLEK